MNEWFKNLIEKAKGFWKSSSVIVKVVVIGIAVVVIAVAVAAAATVE